MQRLPLVLVLALAPACGVEDASPPARRVILISLDTLRADHLSLYGYGRETSPNLDRMGREDAAVFERCFAQASWTLPSHMTILTGLYPQAHGVTEAGVRLAPEIVTLTESLRAAGLATAAFTDAGHMSPGHGLEDGFQEYHDASQTTGQELRGLARTLPQVEHWLRGHADRDFFLFLHTYDIHAPYTVGDPWRSAFQAQTKADPESVAQLEYLATLGDSEIYELERYASLEHLVATYDGMILWADQAVGRVNALLKDLGIYDETLIVITSDHGENFLDDGLYAGHGVFLSDAEVHVPLVIKYPGGRHRGLRSQALVESVDIMPTVLAALGIPPPAGQILQGFDLGALLEGRMDPSPLAYSSGALLQPAAVRSGEWTLLTGADEAAIDKLVDQRLRARDSAAVRARVRSGTLLVPTGSDADENHAEQHPEVAEELQGELAAWIMAQFAVKHLHGHPEGRSQLSERALESLRRLGYQ